MKKHLPLIGMILITVVLAAAITLCASYSAGFASWISTASGAICLTLAALGLLLVLLMGLVTVYSKLGIASKADALGLPDGSIRGLLSLGLLVVFVTLSFFLYSQLSAVHVETQRDVSEEDLKKIPTEQIFDKKDERTAEEIAAKKPVKFELRRIMLPTKSGEDLAKQIFTTISNLLIAIAAFYFGSSAAASARAEGGAKRETPTLGKIENTGPTPDVALAIHGTNLQEVNKVDLEGADGTHYTAEATSNEGLVTTQKFAPQPPIVAAVAGAAAPEYTLVLRGPGGKELARSATKYKILPAAAA